MNFVVPRMTLEYSPEGGDPLAITIEGVRYVPEHSKLLPCKGCRHLIARLDIGPHWGECRLRYSRVEGEFVFQDVRHSERCTRFDARDPDESPDRA